MTGLSRHGPPLGLRTIAANLSHHPALNEREAFVRGSLWGAAIVGAAGVAGLALVGRGAWAAAFGLGAAISLGNVWLISRAVAQLGDEGVALSAWWKGSLLRFVLVGLVLVAALLLFRLNLIALVAGLLLTQMWMVGDWLVRTMAGGH